MDNRSEVEIRADLRYLFDKASHVLTSRTTAALAELGITPRGCCVLAKAQPGTLTQGELAELALLDKTTMVVTVDQLEVVRQVAADGPLGAAVGAPASGRAQRARATRASSQTGVVDS